MKTHREGKRSPPVPERQSSAPPAEPPARPGIGAASPGDDGRPPNDQDPMKAILLDAACRAMRSLPAEELRRQIHLIHVFSNANRDMLATALRLVLPKATHGRIASLVGVSTRQLGRYRHYMAATRGLRPGRSTRLNGYKSSGGQIDAWGDEDEDEDY